MKILIAILLISLNVSATNYYVSATGSDSNPGTIGSPFATWSKLSTVMIAGDIAYIRGGTYRSSATASTGEKYVIQNLTGTITDSIKIFAYPGESPVLNLDDVLSTADPTYSFYLYNCDYVYIKGLRVTGQAQNPSGNTVYGFIIESSDNIKIEYCTVDNIGGQGFFSFNSTNHYFLNCDAHHIGDQYTGWGGSNGFSATGYGNTATGITYDKCRAWWISDDGWDFFGSDGFFTVKNCWSFWNGFIPGTFTTGGDGSGYKLGPTNSSFPATLKRVIVSNLSTHNRTKGFDQNGGDCLYQIYNNTSYDNGTTGYVWSYYPAYAQQSKNNISLSDADTYQGSEIAGTFNSWSGVYTITTADFVSIDESVLDDSRSSDGSLPNISFLNFVVGSDGINVGNNNGYGSQAGCFAYTLNASLRYYRGRLIVQ